MVRPSLTPLRRLREHDLFGRLGVLRLAVLHAGDLDVEHVDLAVDGLELAVGADVDRGVGDAVVPLAALGDRAGDEVDAQLAAVRVAQAIARLSSSVSAPAA